MHIYFSSRVFIQRLAAMLLVLSAGGVAVQAQTQARPPATRHIDFAVGYNAIHANAPPGGCDCFFMQGGRAEANIELHDWLSGVAEISGAHAGRIDSFGDGVSQLTYLFGPRARYRAGHKLSGFGQVLFGGAHGFDGYFPTKTSSSTSANSFALSTGGGIDYSLSPRFKLRLFQADYLYTELPNAQGDRQNEIRLGAGIVFHFR